MSKNYYLITLEALNMRKKKRIVLNKLNEVAIYSNDPKLQTLVTKAIHELEESSTNTEITPLIKFNFIDTKEIQHLCEEKK